MPRGTDTHSRERLRGMVRRARLTEACCMGDAVAESKDMKTLQQRDVGDFRIYAGSFEAHGGGYTAAVEVHRVQGVPHVPEVVFSNECLSGGHRFNTPSAALKHAMDVGHQAIRLREALAA